MRILPIRYSADVDASVRFYEALGLARDTASRPGVWVELATAGGQLAIHRAEAEQPGSCELALAADEPLEAVAKRLTAAGFAGGHILDENFGRSLRVTDPDGTVVQINEFDRELYT